MTYKHRDRAFSLTEVLLAVGALAIGMLFIAGTFLTGIYLTAIAAERTTSAVVADEAFAKIRLYAVGDPSNPADDIDLSRLWTNNFVTFTDAFGTGVYIDPNEFAYPSDNNGNLPKQYYWSALCRRIDPNAASRLVQVTVFVTRKTAGAASYHGGAGRPIPMTESISATPGSNVVTESPGSRIGWINDGCTIMDNRTGQIYRVLQRRDAAPDAFPGPTIELDRPWEGARAGLSFVWVVPPPIGSGKDPCIAIYQKVIRF
jgi:hypothetical protein